MDVLYLNNGMSYIDKHERRQWRVRWPYSPWIFIHDTNIVDRGLIVLFFGIFSVGPTWKRLNSAISRFLFAIFLVFFLLAPHPPANFSTGTLVNKVKRTQNLSIWLKQKLIKTIVL